MWISERPLSEAGMSTQTLKKSDEGSTVAVAKGDHIMVRLPEIATAGFQWTVDAIDETALRLIKSEPVPSNEGIGAANEKILVFEVLKPGVTVRLLLKHWQEWEGETSVTDRFAVIVQSAP